MVVWREQKALNKDNNGHALGHCSEFAVFGNCFDSQNCKLKHEHTIGKLIFIEKNYKLGKKYCNTIIDCIDCKIDQIYSQSENFSDIIAAKQIDHLNLALSELYRYYAHITHKLNGNSKQSQVIEYFNLSLSYNDINVMTLNDYAIYIDSCIANYNDKHASSNHIQLIESNFEKAISIISNYQSKNVYNCHKIYRDKLALILHVNYGQYLLKRMQKYNLSLKHFDNALSIVSKYIKSNINRLNNVNTLCIHYYCCILFNTALTSFLIHDYTESIEWYNILVDFLGNNNNYQFQLKNENYDSDSKLYFSSFINDFSLIKLKHLSQDNIDLIQNLIKTESQPIQLALPWKSNSKQPSLNNLTVSTNHDEKNLKINCNAHKNQTEKGKGKGKEKDKSTIDPDHDHEYKTNQEKLQRLQLEMHKISKKILFLQKMYDKLMKGAQYLQGIDCNDNNANNNQHIEFQVPPTTHQTQNNLKSTMTTPIMSTNHVNWNVTKTTIQTEIKIKSIRTYNTIDIQTNNIPDQENMGDLYISNNLHQLASTFDGCSLICDQLSHMNIAQLQQFYYQILPFAFDWCKHSFANSIIRHFFTITDNQLIIQFVEKIIIPNIENLSLNKYGSCVIQSCLHYIKYNSKITKLILNKINTIFFKCIFHRYGHYILSKCFDEFDASVLKNLVLNFYHNMHKFSCNIFACRVVQKAMEKLTFDQRVIVINEIFDCLIQLSQHQCGNYVVQHCLQHSPLRLRIKMIDRVFENIIELSKHKYGSSVVERCCQCATNNQMQRLISYLISGHLSSKNIPRNSNGIILPYSTNLASLVFDYFGNFVVQTILNCSSREQQLQLVEQLEIMIPNLKKEGFGKHVISKIKIICRRE